MHPSRFNQITDLNKGVVRLTVEQGAVHVVRPHRGMVRVTFDGNVYELPGGRALLMAHPGEAECVWSSCAEGECVTLRGADVQVAASRLMDQPRRLRPGVISFNWGAVAAGRRCEALVRALFSSGVGDEVFVISGSVMRAMERVRTNPEVNWTAETLAAAAGVTAATLRRNFKACFGVSISEIVRERRLVWVSERLGHPRELRSVSQLARDAGFSSPSALARAYHLKFGESPTQTRANSFSSAA